MPEIPDPTIKIPPPGQSEPSGYDVADGDNKPSGPQTQTTIKTSTEGYSIPDDDE